jgi:hypothetical protein
MVSKRTGHPDPDEKANEFETVRTPTNSSKPR